MGISRIMVQPRWIQAAFDLLALVCSFAVFLLVRTVAISEPLAPFTVSDAILVGVVVALMWMAVFWLAGLYRNYYVRSPFEEAFVVMRTVFVWSVLFYLLIYIDSPEHYQNSPRYIFIVYWLLVSASVTSGRLAARILQQWLFQSGRMSITTVVVGSGYALKHLQSAIAHSKRYRYKVLDVVEYPLFSQGKQQSAALTAQLSSILENHRPEELHISMEKPDHDELLAVVAEGSNAGCNVMIVPDMYAIVSGQTRTQFRYGSELIHVNPELMKPWEEAAKRITDITMSLLILLIGLPVWILLAIGVRLSSRGPIFFMQKRVGRHGHIFTMLKFRSMVVDENRGETWTAHNDPRVTRFGWLLRKTHLDEVPQFLNVLRGEMSLVGPRPEQPAYVERFSKEIPYYKRRLKVKPGITGWWQVKAKSNDESREEIESRLRYDFYYIENLSFMLDIEILVRTVFVLVSGHGRA